MQSQGDHEEKSAPGGIPQAIHTHVSHDMVVPDDYANSDEKTLLTFLNQKSPMYSESGDANYNHRLYCFYKILYRNEKPSLNLIQAALKSLGLKISGIILFQTNFESFNPYLHELLGQMIKIGLTGKIHELGASGLLRKYYEFKKAFNFKVFCLFKELFGKQYQDELQMLALREVLEPDHYMETIGANGADLHSIQRSITEDSVECRYLLMRPLRIPVHNVSGVVSFAIDELKLLEQESKLHDEKNPSQPFDFADKKRVDLYFDILNLLTSSKLLPQQWIFLANIPAIKKRIVNDKKYFLYLCKTGLADPCIPVLIKIIGKHIGSLIEQDFYKPFTMACFENNFNLVYALLEAVHPKYHKDMLYAHHYAGFNAACKYHESALIVRYSKLLPKKFDHLITANTFQHFNNFIGFRSDLYSNETLQAAELMLDNNDCLNHVEVHDEANRLVGLYAEKKINDLREKDRQFASTHPNAVFDISDSKEIKRYLYILRKLIRMNTAASTDGIRLLLSIPAIKNAAHQPVRLDALTYQFRSLYIIGGRTIFDRQERQVVPGREQNELLIMALRCGNQDAVMLLQAIPTVRQLAEANQYYRAEIHRTLNIEALVQNRESSMVALTDDERSRLKDGEDRYNPIIQHKGGYAVVMNELRDSLKARYLTTPAMIKGKKTPLNLPIEWSEFQELKLSKDERNQANIAYYQNVYHTVIRYLSKPNPWMARNASYVYTNDDRSERWSSFEEYQPMIAMLYLAAIDKEIPVSAGMTDQHRYEQFISELSHIARAHNWDKTRVRNGKTEEYDDIEGDKPSCYSGVKRRLFQSILEHPLFSVLTKELLRQEMNDFIYHHFENLYNTGNKDRIKRAWDVSIGMADDEKSELDDEKKSPQEVLKEWDISRVSIEEFKLLLSAKYTKRFAENPIYKAIVEETFALVDHLAGSHFEKFYGSANLGKFWGETRSKEEELTVAEIKQIYKKHKGGRAAMLGIFSKNVTSQQVLDRLTERAKKSAKDDSASRLTLQEMGAEVPNRIKK